MKPLPIARLGAEACAPFPPVAQALHDPDGLLAVGGDLSVVRLLNAYRQGIFPWFSPGQPILWWSPDPRMVFDTGSIRLPTKLRRQLRKSDWEVRADSAFDAVIHACATAPRPGQQGTWITHQMVAAYLELHRQGNAHSIEVFAHGQLIGGLYGVAIGRMFFGESMFSLTSGASKVALAGLAHILRRWHWPLIDAQVENEFTNSLGARPMARALFLNEVKTLCALSDPPGSWQARIDPFPASILADLAAWN